MNNSDFFKEYNYWIESPTFDSDTRKELQSISSDINEIQDRFSSNLDFGTAGLRGIIGAGTNRINKYTISRATFGLANYLLMTYSSEQISKGVAIAYDNRHLSKELCQITAETLSACNIKSYIFNDLHSTPELSFTVRDLNCIAGIVITASHNPSNYNGYKVYGPDGAQIMPSVALEITNQINAIANFNCIPTNYNHRLIQDLSSKQDKKYLSIVKTKMLHPELAYSDFSNLKIVYTPLCGTGCRPVTKILKSAGFKNVFVVKEEELPDPNFAGIKSPNPEDFTALSRAIQLGYKTDADCIIATDPDCDRVGLAIKDPNGDFKILSGNEIGGLLIYYILSYLSTNKKLEQNSFIVKSIVTSDFGKSIANLFNIDCIEVLTGFKFIADQINKLEASNFNKFIFGYEESYGYLYGTHVRDKDAVITSLLISEMCAFYKSQKVTLFEILDLLYSYVGYFKDSTISFTFNGIEGKEKINSIMEYFREEELKIENFEISNILDFNNGINNLPKSNVLKIHLKDNSWIALRPSGTEPKLKVYISVKDTLEDEALCKLDKISNTLTNIINNF